jgi:hypothetical protein
MFSFWTFNFMIVGVLGEAQALGSMHMNFWSKLTFAAVADEVVRDSVEPEYCYWLPTDIEIIMVAGSTNASNANTKSNKNSNALVIVSTRSVVAQGGGDGPNSPQQQRSDSSASVIRASSADHIFAQQSNDESSCKVAEHDLWLIVYL